MPKSIVGVMVHELNSSVHIGSREKQRVFVVCMLKLSGLITNNTETSNRTCLCVLV